MTEKLLPVHPSPNDLVVGVDNGVTGSVAILRYRGLLTSPELVDFFSTPAKSVPPAPGLSLAKGRVKMAPLVLVPRVPDVQALVNRVLKSQMKPGNIFWFIEPPLRNPGRWKASLSAAVSDHVLYQALTQLPFSWVGYVSARTWQAAFGLAEEQDKKRAGLALASKWFPQHAKTFADHGDADSVFLALFPFKVVFRGWYQLTSTA